MIGPPTFAAQRITPDNPPLSPTNQINSTVANSGSGTQSDVPTYATYRFFFLNMALLDQAADQDEKKGQVQTAALWRTHEQRAAGLTEAEGEILKQLVQQCNQVVKDQDTKIQAALKDFRGKRAGDLTVPIPPALLQMGEERTAIITAHIDKIRVALGEASFQKLDSYVQSSFKPHILNPQTSPKPGPGKIQKEEQ
jgi:hypothetical protein